MESWPAFFIRGTWKMRIGILIAALVIALFLGCGSSADKNKFKDADRPKPAEKK